jgi:tetratricopeptide (TPR) repeat protein
MTNSRWAVTRSVQETSRARLLALILLLGSPGALLAQETDPAALSQRGSALMAARRYAEAVPVYRDLVKAVPGNAGLLRNLGMALHLSGQDDEAIAPLEAALKLDPDSAPAALFLGASRMSLGRTAAAVAPLQKAVRLQPENREARSTLADALVILDRHAEAEPHLRRLSRASPKDPVVWFALGKTYEALAGQAFGRLLERDPESALTLALVAEARLDEGQTTAAFQLYRRALERAPSQRGLHAGVAEVYRRTGHADWAALEEDKEKSLSKVDCARDALECAFAAGKHREVLAAASKLETPVASYWLARSCNALAVEAFARLTALPPSAPSHEWTASFERNAGRYAESAEEWRKAIALAPGEPRLKLELAVTLRLNQDLAGAQQVLEGVRRDGFDTPEASYLLGDVLLARQQPEPAIPLLEKAVRLEPKLLEAHGALGRAYALVGRPADAIPHLERALATDSDGSLRYQLARSYQAAGRPDDARRALADYEAFRKAAGAGKEASGQGVAITPP